MKKVFYSVTICFVIASSAFATNVDKEIYLKSEIKNNTESNISNDVDGNCSGSFGLYDPSTGVLKFVINKSKKTLTEKECLDWVGTQTLVIADQNPSYDVRSTGSYFPL